MPQAQVTPGAVYQFDASLDTGGDAVWDNTGSFGFETMTFVSGYSDGAQVSDGTLDLLAFGEPADGASNAYEQNFGGSQLSRQNATFEVWFKPANLTTANQIIWETGGSGSGTDAFTLEQQSRIPCQWRLIDLTLATTLSNNSWHQFVGVVNNTNDDDSPMIQSTCISMVSSSVRRAWRTSTTGRAATRADWGISAARLFPRAVR